MRKKSKEIEEDPVMAAEKVVQLVGIFCAVVFTAICVGVALLVVGFLAGIIF